MKNPKLTVAASVLLAGSFSAAQAVTIASWGSTVDDGDLEGVTGSFSTGVVDSVQGAGMIPHTNNGENGDLISDFKINGGEIIYSSTTDGTVDDTTTFGDAIADNQYFQFTFEVSGLGSGDTLTIDTFNFSARRNISSQRVGWLEGEVAYRVNDTTFGTGDSVGSFSMVNNADVQPFTIAAAAGLPSGLVNGDTVNFRIYAWGSDAKGAGNIGNASTRLGALSIEGTAVPEPSTAGLLAGIFAMGHLMLRRRRD